MSDLEELNAEQTLYSPKAEEAVIGAALIAPMYIQDIDLEPEHFYIAKHQMIWAVLKDLDRRDVNPDFITVGNELDNRKQLAEIGGVAYLSSFYVMDGSVSTVNVDNYAAIVKTCASRRKLMRLANRLANLAMDKNKPIDQATAEIMTEMATIDGVRKGADHWGKYLTQADEYVTERSENPGKVWGMATGITAYDEITGGLQPSELRILSGDPGIGKSFYILQEATYLGEHAEPGAIYSLEMTGMAVGLRALALESNVKSRTMKTGTMTSEDWDAYYKALERLHSLPIYMDDSEDWTTTSLRSDLARLVRLHGVKWAMVDYSYLLKDAPNLDETQRSQIVSKACKGIAKSLGISLTLIHSKNKAGMQAENSQQSALRGGGQVIYDADIILFLENPDKNNLSIVRGTFGKGRELDDARKYYDLIRLNGSPKYRPVETRRIQL